MKWEGHQESGNVEDRRRLGKKGLALADSSRRAEASSLQFPP